MARLAKKSSSEIHANTEALKALADKAVADGATWHTQDVGEETFVPEITSLDGDALRSK